MAAGIQLDIDISLGDFARLAMVKCHEAGYSFALWKLPNSTAVQFAASISPSRIHDINLENKTPGFIFAPFDPGEKKIFLPTDEFFKYDAGHFVSLTGSLLQSLHPRQSGAEITNQEKKYFIRDRVSAPPADDGTYLKLVTRCRDAVAESRFDKLVPSRCKKVPLPKHFDVAETFMALGKRYPTAMVSVFSSPASGTWVGATPEMLVKVDAQQRFHTAAVAGTQRFVPGTDIRTITWAQKEIEEQGLVERYVINCFKKIRLREFEELGPKTVVAGNVVHLKTEFEVDMVATRYPQLGTVMLQLLHPTSAVCGMPMDQALLFLKEHEGYDRQFYSGYLGPVNIANESQVFVNLRCMQLFGDTAVLYAGAGVLADSDPEKEWQETELKMNTLLEVIRD